MIKGVTINKPFTVLIVKNKFTPWFLLVIFGGRLLISQSIPFTKRFQIGFDILNKYLEFIARDVISPEKDRTCAGVTRVMENVRSVQASY